MGGIELANKFDAIHDRTPPPEGGAPPYGGVELAGKFDAIYIKRMLGAKHFQHSQDGNIMPALRGKLP